MTESEGLSDDWQPPLRRLQEDAWDKHPERGRLIELSRERDENGEKVWVERLEEDPDDASWAMLWLRTVDPRDSRPDELIGRWPNSVPERAQADAQAIVDEHHPHPLD
jgi:hypothetical protein